MKITIGSISLDIFLFLRLCLPATLFIGVCTGILLPFNLVLRITAQIAPDLIGGAWLSLLIFYIVLGVAFTRFTAKHLHSSFGSEERHTQRRMAFLSGSPFYALCLLFLFMSIYSMIFPDINALTAFVSIAGFFGFAIVSCSYFLLLHFFLSRLSAN
jgi:hypothetical protein